jgi:hypothetical protein
MIVERVTAGVTDTLLVVGAGAGAGGLNNSKKIRPSRRTEGRIAGYVRIPIPLPGFISFNPLIYSD